LVEIWEELFSTRFDDNFSIEQCPMLIGITRSTDAEKCWSSISEYEFTTLLKSDTITSTNEKVTRETLVRELIIFKEKCDKNEKVLVSVVFCLTDSMKYEYIYYQLRFSHMIFTPRLAFVGK
jgi:hypothetical protein